VRYLVRYGDSIAQKRPFSAESRPPKRRRRQVSVGVFSSKVIETSTINQAARGSI